MNYNFHEMNLNQLTIPVKIKNDKFKDKRGYFQEIYLKKKFNLQIKFTAIAYSKKNVIRGLHFQLKNKQSKLIYVSNGKILDVAVNLKKIRKILVKYLNMCLKKAIFCLYQVSTLTVMNVYLIDQQYFIISKSIEILKVRVASLLTIKY